MTRGRLRLRHWTGQVWSTTLKLTNGTSEVFVEGIQAYDGDPQHCTADLADQLASDPNVSNLRMLDPDSQLDARSDTTSRSVVQYSYTFSYSDGTTEEMVKHMECLTLTPGASVLMINAFILFDSFQAQSTAVYELLDGLVIGE